ATAAPVDATAAPVDATAAPVEATAAPVDATAAPVEATAAPVEATAAPVEAAVEGEPTTTAPHEVWQPTMPPLPTAPTVPWKTVAPSLVIDDADPDRAEREQDERAASERAVTFLPPILLDREDRSARQGGLTLAVIILLIAATLTLSYLMRRPSVSGDGVTMTGTSATLT
ncbi:MAG TPA: hypothetical protein VLX92_24295, partial [Kofleriaceae bacterium]|nr:hypothetical protein [Kofleriaceae bacterium]